MNTLIKKTIVALILSMCSFSIVNAMQSNLVLNGEGVREKFFVDIFKMSLFLKEKKSDSKYIINSDDDMNLRLKIVSSLINTTTMQDGILECFNKEAEGDITLIKPELDKFLSIFKEELGKNDVYDFTYIPGVGTQVYKNSEFKETISGLDFKKAFFSIWLGKKTDHNDLRDGLLGKNK